MTIVTRRDHPPVTPPAGVRLRESGTATSGLLDRLGTLGLASHIATITVPGTPGTTFRMHAEAINRLAAGTDTPQLCASLDLDPVSNADDLEREILLSLMMSPICFEYRNFGELACAVNVRKNIVAAARKTVLAFDTTMAAERPSDCWTFADDKGFTLLPGRPLIEALRKATQPEMSGKHYAFSCYRATEYVILLGIAEELEKCNPSLLGRLQRQWEKRAIKSGAFHETFLIEYGSMQAPLPLKHYVPGDRLWFRNPDNLSSDVDGYEGSWVFYLGNGEFANFWKAGKPFTLTSKCVEIFHWRHALCQNPDGRLWIDEALVDQRVRATLDDPDEVVAILEQMMRLRDPQGVYGDGGCIDATREYPKSVHPGATQLDLPDA